MKQPRLRFSPTPRLALAAFGTAIPFLLPGVAWLTIAAALLLLAAAVVDLLASRRSLEAMRKLPLSPLSLGAANPVAVEVRCLDGDVELELKDDLPLPFTLTGEWPRVRLQGGNWQPATYQVTPSQRGQYALGPLHGRYRSPLGLWVRQITWPLSQPVRVYPNLLAARQWELAMRQGRTLEGLKRARIRGTGTEFESLREYQEGDQYRALNWPATARLGRLVTNLYQIDRSQPVMLLLDAGRMMIPQVAGLARLDHALNAALLLATVAAERGDQVGALLFGGEVQAFVPPRKGRGQVMAMLESLYDATPEQVEPDYARMIGWFRYRHKKRSLVVLFTDLMEPEVNRGLIAHLGALAAHHLVLVVCMTDPALLQLAQCEPSDSRQVYQKASALEVLAERAEARSSLQSRGVMVVDVAPKEFSAAVVNQYLMIKEQGRL